MGFLSSVNINISSNKDALYYGFKNDGTTNNSTILSTLTSKLGTEQSITFPAGIYYFSITSYFPSQIKNIILLPGAIFKVATGVTLTINARIKAESDQYIFNFVGTGTITGITNSKIYPDWFGAIPDGSTNSSIAVQTAIKLCGSESYSKVVEFGTTGIYTFENIIIDRNRKGLVITGHGAGTTVKLLSTSTNGIMFAISNYVDNYASNIEDIEICNLTAIGNNTTTASESWFLHSWMNGAYTINNIKLHDLNLSNWKTSGMSVEDCINAKIYNITTHDNTKHGFSVETGNFEITQVYAYNNGLYGIDFAGGSDGTGIGKATVTNLICDSNGYGIKSAGRWDLNLTNVNIYNSTVTAITKTTSGGIYNFTNVVTKNNAGSSLEAITGDGTEVYNINGYHSYGDNQITKTTNGSMFFASTIKEVHGNNINIHDSGNTGLVIACKKTFLTNCSVLNNLASYAIKITGGLIATNLRQFCNATSYGVQINTSENVMFNQCEFGGQQYGIDLNGTGRFSFEKCDFSNCDPNLGIADSTNSKKVEIRGCINSGNYDQKRIQVTALPTTGTWAKGDIAVHVDANGAESGEWQCVTGGTLGVALSGITGSISSASDNLIVNSLTGLYQEAVLSIPSNATKRIIKLPNALASTTVDSDSAINQRVLNVTSTTNFNVGDHIVIGRETAREENAQIYSIQSGVSLTLCKNLTITHLASNADIVENAVKLSAVASTAILKATPATLSFATPEFKVVNTLTNIV